MNHPDDTPRCDHDRVLEAWRGGTCLCVWRDEDDRWHADPCGAPHREVCSECGDRLDPHPAAAPLLKDFERWTDNLQTQRVKLVDDLAAMLKEGPL
jgi:hypothetical protein